MYPGLEQTMKHALRRHVQASFDKVQEIVSQQVPFLYLVTRNALVAVSPSWQNANPSVLRPQVGWNIEMLALAPEVTKK